MTRKPASGETAQVASHRGQINSSHAPHGSTWQQHILTTTPATTGHPIFGPFASVATCCTTARITPNNED
jgi:hypothetical protein